MVNLQKASIIPLLMSVVIISVISVTTGCGGGGGSGGSGGSGGTSVASDPAGTDTVTGGSTVLPHSATLTWTAPETNADGTVLTDLDGYRIYYGTVSGNYTEVKDVGIPSCDATGNKTICSYTIEDLGPGTWYFAVTAYDSSGNESDYSNEVSKEVSGP